MWASPILENSLFGVKHVKFANLLFMGCSKVFFANHIFYCKLLNNPRLLRWSYFTQTENIVWFWECQLSASPHFRPCFKKPNQKLSPQVFSLVPSATMSPFHTRKQTWTSHAGVRFMFYRRCFDTVCFSFTRYIFKEGGLTAWFD